MSMKENYVYPCFKKRMNEPYEPNRHISLTACITRCKSNVCVNFTPFLHLIYCLLMNQNIQCSNFLKSRSENINSMIKRTLTSNSRAQRNGFKKKRNYGFILLCKVREVTQSGAVNDFLFFLFS